MNNKFFYILVAGFTLGILFSSFLKLGFSFFLFLLILSVLVFIFGYFLAQRRSTIILLAIFILSLALGILRYEIKDIHLTDSLAPLVGQKIILTGIITDEPNIKDKSAQLTVIKETGEKVLIMAPLFPEFKYGDLIEVVGKLEKPDNFETDNGKDFDYIGFLAKEDIYYQISFAEVKIISSGHGSWLKEKMFNLKNAFIKKINFLIKEPESSLLNGLLLGAKNSLGVEWQDDFRTAGVSHIVALSGYNITIVAVGIMAILAFLPSAFSLSFGILGIIFFAVMTGGTATVIRAAIMALLVILARQTNRKYDITRALLLAGTFMLVQNPKILVFDLSFQLSFLATLALILVSPLVEKHLTFIPEKFHLRELAVATVATQIFVLPFLLYKMGLFSVYALFANILILPILPIVMFFGFFTGLVGFISTFLAWPLAFISTLLLSYMLKVIAFFADLPFSSLSIKNFPLVLSVLIYGIFLVIIWRIQKKDETR